MIGGHEVATPGTPGERRLRNVVDEMAIATGLKSPRVFVLDREQAINALAAGWEPQDSVIAVTRGALDRLTRAELQGVVAHEFAHILNGDTRLNMRLIGMVFGLQMVFNLGRSHDGAGRPRPARRRGADRPGAGRGGQHRLAGRSIAQSRRVAPARVPGRRLCRAVHAPALGYRRRAAQDRHPVAARPAPAARQRRGGVPSAAVVRHLAESGCAGDPSQHRGAAAPHLRPQHGRRCPTTCWPWRKTSRRNCRRSISR